MHNKTVDYHEFKSHFVVGIRPTKPNANKIHWTNSSVCDKDLFICIIIYFILYAISIGEKLVPVANSSTSIT